MNYKLIFKKALHTPGALNAWLAQQPAYRSINIHPYLVKLIPAMERYAKRTGSDRMLRELHQNILWIEQRHNSYLAKHPPKPRRTNVARRNIPFAPRMQQAPAPRMAQPVRPQQAAPEDYNKPMRDYIVKCMNEDIRNFDALKMAALKLIQTERALGVFDAELWDGYACYFESPELNAAG
ncbi:MAG: hypothetical protein R2797_07355 [Gelidibacter sp.]